MAETLVGAKSKLYIKEEIPGFKESGDTLQHVTAQEIAGNRVGLDTVIHGLYRTHVPPKLIEVGSVKRLIKITAHGARKGDILKINNGTAVGEEVAIVKIEDADTLIIATEINAAIGDEVFVMRHVTPLYDKDGNLNVNATPGPAQFVQNGIDVEVEEDTVTMANNKPMPGGMYIKKDDGSWYPVTLDTTNPYAHTPIPVAITDVTGTSNVNVDLSGSSLSVNIEHDGVSPSSIKIGDGTRLTSVTVNNELKVKDTDTLAQLVDIEAKQDTQITALGSLLTELQLKADLTETQPVSLATIPLATGASTEVKQDAAITAIGSLLTELQLKADLTDTQPVNIQNASIAVTGPLTNAELVAADLATETKQDTMIASLASIAAEDFSTETTLSAMSAKLPAALGQGTMAQSLTVTVASDQGALPVTPTNNSGTITNAQVTVGTSAVRATVSGSAPSAARKKLIIKSSKNNTGSIYLGSSSVTTANGLEIIGPDRLEFELDASDYYLISDTAAQVVEVLEVV